MLLQENCEFSMHWDHFWDCLFHFVSYWRHTTCTTEPVVLSLICTDLQLVSIARSGLVTQTNLQTLLMRLTPKSEVDFKVNRLYGMASAILSHPLVTTTQSWTSLCSANVTLCSVDVYTNFYSAFYEEWFKNDSVFPSTCPLKTLILHKGTLLICYMFHLTDNHYT